MGHEDSRRAGISYSHLTEIENGNKSPSSATLERLAGALRVRPHDLLRRSDSLERSEHLMAPEAPTEAPQGAWSHFAVPASAPPAPAARAASQDPIAELLALASRLGDDDLQTLVALARRLSDRG